MACFCKNSDYVKFIIQNTIVMNDKDKLEKLLSLQIENKMKGRNTSGDVITHDQLIAEIAISSGIAEEKVRETLNLLYDGLEELYFQDKAKFIEALKVLTGTNDIEIIEDDC